MKHVSPLAPVLAEAETIVQISGANVGLVPDRGAGHRLVGEGHLGEADGDSGRRERRARVHLKLYTPYAPTAGLPTRGRGPSSKDMSP